MELFNTRNLLGDKRCMNFTCRISLISLKLLNMNENAPNVSKYSK